MRIPIYRLHNFIIKPVESIVSSNSTRIIPNFTDEKYKLEQNIHNSKHCKKTNKTNIKRL